MGISKRGNQHLRTLLVHGARAVVRNGVYIAELTVAYADGSRDRVRRKVAVVR